MSEERLEPYSFSFGEGWGEVSMKEMSLVVRPDDGFNTTSTSTQCQGCQPLKGQNNIYIDAVQGVVKIKLIEEESSFLYSMIE